MPLHQNLPALAPKYIPVAHPRGGGFRTKAPPKKNIFSLNYTLL